MIGLFKLEFLSSVLIAETGDVTDNASGSITKCSFIIDIFSQFHCFGGEYRYVLGYKSHKVYYLQVRRHIFS